MPLDSITTLSPSFPNLRPIPVVAPQIGNVIPDVELRELRPEIPPEVQGLKAKSDPGVRSGHEVEAAIQSFVHSVDDKSKVAGKNVAALMAGEDVSLGETMISLQESQISFELMVEVRNRLLEGYQELMRMQV